MKRNKAYLIGIKGVAMTALAVYLKEKGWRVTGSDVEDIFPTDRILRRLKIKIKPGFHPGNIKGKYDLVVVTGAHGGMTNPEARYAKKKGLPTFMHGEVLGMLMKDKVGISIAGCHGKTTTTSLTASLLVSAGLDPSYAVGTSEINNLAYGGHFGRGNFFVVEADEYMTCPKTCPKPRFLWQEPKILVVTNIEYDHPDAFSDLDEVRNAFLRFTQKLPNSGIAVVCIDDKNIRKILPHIKREIITYGFSPQADYRITDFYFGDGVSFMRIRHKEIDLGEFMLQIPGRHNLLNATAASIVANQMGIGWEEIRQYLKLYTGCKRRFEKIGQYRDVFLYDDYAHHPSEVIATISGAKKWFSGKRIIVIFQPHTFSRTKALFSDFTKAFNEANIAVITDIYPSARETYNSTISSQILVAAVNKYKSNAIYKKGLPAVLSFLKKNLQRGDLIITMGAGDIFSWHEEIIGVMEEYK